jgi:hypothetical protein
VTGKQQIEDLITATFKEFSDFEELRLVIRNAVLPQALVQVV